MPQSCPKGEIWRVGYVRSVGKKKSKKSKKGSKSGMKRIVVEGSCIRSTSQTGEKTSVLSRQILDEKEKIHQVARSKFGTPKCTRGEIVREGFKRKSKSGKQVWVAPVCVKDTGKAGKQKRLFYLEPGRLGKYGYDDVAERSDLARHTALKAAVEAGEKPLSVSRRLNALATLTKNTNPKLSKKFKQDSEWIKRSSK